MSANTLADIPVRPFTRQEYHALAHAGILTERDRVELIKGRIVPMMPIGPWHTFSTSRFIKRLVRAYGDAAIVNAGNPVGLGESSEPQPDVTVLRWRDDEYASSHPTPADVVVLIEIADTSRAFDLGTKHDLYAEEGVSEYWVVDRQMAAIHVFRKPRDGIFTETRVYSKGERIPLPECGEATFLVDDSGV